MLTCFARVQIVSTLYVGALISTQVFDAGRRGISFISPTFCVEKREGDHGAMGDKNVGAEKGARDEKATCCFGQQASTEPG